MMNESWRKLVKDLESSDAGKRAAAVAALGSLGAGAQNAVPYLFAALDDWDEAVRRQARVALQRVTAATTA